MRIVCLAENTARAPNIEAEHGLSLYIEAGECRILFDMGQSGLFARNADRLGVDLSRVDLAVVSHGHYDHGGGLPRFLEINRRAPVYVCRRAFEPHYNAEGRFIGLEPWLASSPRIIRTERTTPLRKGITLYTSDGRERLHPSGVCGLTMAQAGVLLPDDFAHEHYLLLEEGEKRILISGCSHIGILDIARWFEPEVLVGGFHLSKMPLDEELWCKAERLDRADTEFYTCHCTGTEQYEFMRGAMSRLHYLSAGNVIEI